MIKFEDVAGYEALVDPISGMTVEPWTVEFVENWCKDRDDSPQKIMKRLHKEVEKVGVHYVVNRDGDIKCTPKCSLGKCGGKYFGNYGKAIQYAGTIKIVNELNFS